MKGKERTSNWWGMCGLSPGYAFENSGILMDDKQSTEFTQHIFEYKLEREKHKIRKKGN